MSFLFGKERVLASKFSCSTVKMSSLVCLKLAMQRNIIRGAQPLLTTSVAMYGFLKKSKLLWQVIDVRGLYMLLIFKM